jgi:tricarballylate dehydrogenase
VSWRGFPERIRFKSVVASAGGFQANREWLRQYWGDAADNFQIAAPPMRRAAS